MPQKIIKFEMNNAISLENSSDIKEELQDENYLDNKVCVSETAVNIGNTELNELMRNDKISKYETLSVDHIKTELPSSEVNDTVNNTVKIEARFSPVNIQIEYSSGLPFCNHCHEVYQDYCTKCRVLVHILNQVPSRNIYTRIRELPEYMLEIRELLGRLGIFSLKVVPENVRFGPFTGLSSTGLSLKIKGGRFVVSGAKSEHLNWMQYINPARNINEQNLFPFQYQDELYYCSTRRIQEGEELLVYFGEQYVDNLIKNVEMDFSPIAKEDIENVFACTFCCLGFSSKQYLAEHKAVSHSEANEKFSTKELAQCSFCRIYLEAEEYLEHHMDYCRETIARHCVFPSAEVHKLQVGRCSSVRSKAKRWSRGIYKCTQCNFRTMFNANFRHHTNQHYEIKMYKCEICSRRYKTRESLKAHVKKIHADNEGRDVKKHSRCDDFKANIKNMKERSPRSHAGGNLKSLPQIKHLNRLKYKCANCEFKTYYKTYLDMHMKMKHLMMKADYKSVECEYQTNYKLSSEIHIKRKHLKQNYKCAECEYQTCRKSHLEAHIKTIHLKVSDYKCAECEYRTNYKSNLEVHIKIKHLKQHDYKCTECEYKTCRKSILQVHINRKHLKQKDYKCVDCEYKTYSKSHLEVHMKTIHLKIRDYKCAECQHTTYLKSHLEAHIKTKHLKVRDYKCAECEYRTNYKSYLRVHMKRKHVKQDYKCSECEYKTNNKSYLEAHIKTKHLKQMDYKCAECEYQTNYKYHLQVHIKTKHLSQKDYKCPECEYKTNYKAYLPIHMKTRHLKQKDYKCLECEYKTNNKSYLEAHIKTKHLKQMDYKCAECQYKTNYKSQLEIHKKQKHLKQIEYQCPECEYKTNYKSYLPVHIKIKHLKQNYYPCSECEYKTNKKSRLEVHIKTIHLKQMDYKCAECEYKTNYKWYLEAHIKTKHLKQMDYKCAECEFKTNNKSYLQVHIKTKHLKVCD